MPPLRLVCAKLWTFPVNCVCCSIHPVSLKMKDFRGNLMFRRHCESLHVCVVYGTTPKHLRSQNLFPSGHLSGNTAEVPLQISLLLCLHVCFPHLFHHGTATSQHIFFKALTGALGYQRLQLHQLLQSLIEALWCEFVLLPKSDRKMKTTWLRSPVPLYRGISGINSV